MAALQAALSSETCSFHSVVSCHWLNNPFWRRNAHDSRGTFFNLYNHGFIRVAVGVPEVQVADPAFNATKTIMLMHQAVAEKAVLALFPELGLSAYSCEDLFHQQALLDGTRDALHTVLTASTDMNLIAVIGVPLQVQHLLFNCAVVLYRGQILGVVPKTYPPNSVNFTSCDSSLPPPPPLG